MIAVRFRAETSTEDDMRLTYTAFACVLALSTSFLPAGAEHRGGSRWLPDTALTFDQELEPAAPVDALLDCKRICEKDERCDGWTFFPRNFVRADGRPERWEALRGACVMGSGVREWSRDSGLRKGILYSAPGRISGVIIPPLGCPENLEPGAMC